MASTIAAGTTSGTAIAIAGDTSGVLQLQTNGTTAAVTIDTNQRTAFVAGTALLPAITTTGDTNTGVFFPAADTIAFAEGGTEVMRIDSTGTVGIGTTNPNSFGKFAVNGDLGITNGKFAYFYNSANSNYSAIACVDTTGTAFYTAATERMRITSAGDLLVGQTAVDSSGGFAVVPSTSASGAPAILAFNKGNAANETCLRFKYQGSQVGSISYSNTTTAYNTSSDYRLKENVAPMTNALATVSALKPVTYKWKIDGSDGQGFIAHELQEVVPDAVVGEKDQVETYTDEDGNEQTRIKPQGVDTSFLVATLTAAIQELNAKVEAQAVRIAELEGAK